MAVRDCQGTVSALNVTELSRVITFAADAAHEVSTILAANADPIAVMAHPKSVQRAGAGGLAGG